MERSLGSGRVHMLGDAKKYSTQQKLETRTKACVNMPRPEHAQPAVGIAEGVDGKRHYSKTRTGRCPNGDKKVRRAGTFEFFVRRANLPGRTSAKSTENWKGCTEKSTAKGILDSMHQHIRRSQIVGLFPAPPTNPTPRRAQKTGLP